MEAVTALALLILAAPGQVKLLAPPEGFRAGREGIVGIAVVDESGALDPAAAAPSISADGGKAGEPVKVTDGLWESLVTPSGAGTMTLSAKSGGVKGSLAAPVRASDEATLALSLGKNDLAPGESAPVTVTIEVKDPSGAPKDDAAPAVDITGGSVSAPTKTAPGVWTAKIKLPDRRFPQALLVVATLPGHDARPAAAVLTMRGKAVVPITTEPHAKVTVRVGRKSYGPLEADKYGELKPEIIASPADQTYDIESEDSAGNKNTKTVALDVPQYDRLWARADASPAWLDGRTRVRLEAIGLDKKGNLRKEDMTATLDGTPITMTGDGEFYWGEARLPLPPGDHAGVVTAAGETQKVSIKATRPPPVAIKIVAVPEAVSSKGTPSAVTAQLVDGAGNPVPDGSIGLSVEGLALSGARTAPGTSTGNVSLMKGTPAAAGTLQLSAKAEGPGFLIRARRTIPVQAGPPAKAAMTGDVPKMVADGSSVAEIGTRIVDSDDYPVTGLTPTATSTRGQVLNLHDAGDGMYKFTLRAPPPSQAGTARVIVQAGDARAETTVFFQKPPTRQSLAAAAGYTSNLGALGSMVAWVEGRRSLGVAEGPWTLTARGQLARGTFDANVGASYTITVMRESGYVGIRRRLAAVKGWQLAAAGAVGAGMVQVQQDPPGFAKSGLVPGGRVALGVEHSSGAGSLLVEGGYEYAVGPANVIKGQLGGVGLSVGYRHGF